MLLCSKGSISRSAKALLGRASAKVHWTLWHPARALVNKKDFQMGSPFLLSEKCEALLDTQLLCSKGSISRDAKAPLGRAKAKVHRTLWHPARALVKKSCHTNLINQCDSPNFNYKLLYILYLYLYLQIHANSGQRLSYTLYPYLQIHLHPYQAYT